MGTEIAVGFYLNPPLVPACAIAARTVANIPKSCFNRLVRRLPDPSSRLHVAEKGY